MHAEPIMQEVGVDLLMGSSTRERRTRNRLGMCVRGHVMSSIFLHTDPRAKIPINSHPPRLARLHSHCTAIRHAGPSALLQLNACRQPHAVSSSHESIVRNPVS